MELMQAIGAARKRKLDDYIEGYILERRMGGLSERTLESYQRTLADFRKEVGENVSNANTDAVRSYLMRVFDRGCGKNTLALYHTHLNIFFEWLIDCEVIKKNPVHGIPKARRDKPLPRFLDHDQVNRLLACCGGAFNGERLRAVIMTFMGTGIRCSELCALEIGDIEGPTGILKVRNGKGGKGRMIPIAPDLEPVLLHWLEVRRRYLHGKERAALFVTRVYGRPTRDNIYDQIRNVGQRAGVAPISPHTLRHTFATMYVSNGGSLVALKEILGHKSLETTQKYLHTSAKTVQLDLFKASPLRKLERERMFPLMFSDG